MVIFNPRPTVTFTPSQASIEMEETLLRCLVLKDKQNFGASYLESHLTKLFPVPNWDWIARRLTDDTYLIEPPDAEWRSLAISKGKIWLGDECFPIDPYEPRRHDGCIRLEPVWVKIRGLPPHLWKDFDVERLVDGFRGYVMEVDPMSAEPIDFVRIRFLVRAREDIPKCRQLMFVDDDDDSKQMSYVLTFEIEDDPQSDVALESSDGASSSEGNKSIAAWN
ncbi:ta11-like non-LTR retrotransposon isoform X1 [Carex rostrata]